jgi:hypothetical protein
VLGSGAEYPRPEHDNIYAQYTFKTGKRDCSMPPPTKPSTVGKLMPMQVRTVPKIGSALLPYYKTILPLINGFKNRSST